MQSKSRGAFSRQERKAAMWMLLAAMIIAAFGWMIQQWTGPSLGPWSGDQTIASIPGVLDAQPITSAL